MAALDSTNSPASAVSSAAVSSAATSRCSVDSHPDGPGQVAAILQVETQPERTPHGGGDLATGKVAAVRAFAEGRRLVVVTQQKRSDGKPLQFLGRQTAGPVIPVAERGVFRSPIVRTHRSTESRAFAFRDWGLSPLRAAALTRLPFEVSGDDQERKPEKKA